jgi:hypothetical protein
MSHFLAARLSAAAHRGRVVASLVGVLALVAALFAMTAAAGAATHPPAGHSTKQHAAKKDQKGKAGDKGRAEQAQCDSWGTGNPCHPPQACGENSGPHNANDQCPAGKPECPAAGNQGGDQQTAGYKAKGAAAKAKVHKVKNDGAANCPKPAPDCKPGEVKKDGYCVPAPQCKPGEAVKNGYCVPAPQCKPGEVVQNGYCVPAEQCKPPNVVQNGMCVPAEQCKPPNVVQNGMCVPPSTPVCVPPQVLQNGACMTPSSDTAGTVVQQTPATTPAATTTAAPQTAVAPQSTVAGTQARSATARLQTQARCGSRAFRVTISGRNIRRVTLFVAGRRTGTVTMPAGRRSITVSVPVRGFGARRQSVQARVTFRNGAAARTLTASATRCAQTAVSPQFTG